jgi:hypothetical protein
MQPDIIKSLPVLEDFLFLVGLISILSVTVLIFDFVDNFPEFGKM